MIRFSENLVCGIFFGVAVYRFGNVDLGCLCGEYKEVVRYRMVIFMSYILGGVVSFFLGRKEKFYWEVLGKLWEG